MPTWDRLLNLHPEHLVCVFQNFSLKIFEIAGIEPQTSIYTSHPDSPIVDILPFSVSLHTLIILME